MIREQPVIKLPNAEIPSRVFDEPGFWALGFLVILAIVAWIVAWRRK